MIEIYCTLREDDDDGDDDDDDDDGDDDDDASLGREEGLCAYCKKH